MVRLTFTVAVTSVNATGSEEMCTGSPTVFMGTKSQSGSGSSSSGTGVTSSESPGSEQPIRTHNRVARSLTGGIMPKTAVEICYTLYGVGVTGEDTI